jgi:hypothetical protein
MKPSEQAAVLQDVFREAGLSIEVPKWSADAFWVDDSWPAFAGAWVRLKRADVLVCGRTSMARKVRDALVGIGYEIRSAVETGGELTFKARWPR